MTCSRCGVMPAEAGARLCARCLLLVIAIDAGDPVVCDAEDAPPCELLSIIGETPRAVTFLGEQRWPIRRLVALKVLKVEACSAVLPTRALGPAPAHPTIAPVLESGYMGGHPYTMTAFVGGGPVARRYAHAATTIAARLQALLAVTDALSFAHARGVPHGRLVSSNVLCEPQAPFAVRIVDFECNARKAGGTVPENVLVQEDVGAVIVLADLLLNGTGTSLPRDALDSLRQSTLSALDLYRQLEYLRSRVTPS